VINNELVAFDHPESGYLLYLTETGGIGFLCIMLLILFPLIKSLITFFEFRDINHILFISAILCWIVGFYSTDSLGDVRMKIWVLMIFAIMISYRLKQTETKIEEETTD
jgi:O-antigen ligase